MTTDDAAPAVTGRGRGRGAIALVVIASLLLPFAAMTLWVRNLVLDTDRYVDTVAPLAHDQAVQDALARRISVELVDALDVETRAEDALPARAQFLAGPIATGAQQLTERAAATIIESDAFATVWDAVNRAAHDQVVAVATGKDEGTITTDNGQVVLNLRPVAALVAQRLAKIAPGLAGNIDVSRINARFVLIASDELASVQSYTHLLDQLAWVLPILVLVLYGVALAISPRRRRTALGIGLGVAIAMTLTLVAYGLARTVYLDSLPSAVQSSAAAAATFDTLTRFLQRGLRMLLVVGLLVVLVAWLLGPGRGAVAVRRQWHRLRAAGADAEHPGPAGQWIGAHRRPLQAGVLVAVVLLFVTWPRPTGLVVVFLAVLALVGLAAIELLGAGATDEPAPTA